MTTPPPTAAPTAAESESKTYWCHECDMSVSLNTSPSPLLCPHCHTHFLELMDSPFSQNDVESILPSSLFDVVLEETLLLLTPPQTKSRTETVIIPIITVTQTLLSLLDSNGVVSCAVCRDLVSVDEEAKQLRCNHLYHSDCITPWLLLRSSCPLCRTRVSEEEDDVVENGDEEGGDEVDLSSGDVMRQMVSRLSEFLEDDYYGLRITLNHIASRHAVMNSSGSGAGESRDVNSELVGGVVDEES